MSPALDVCIIKTLCCVARSKYPLAVVEALLDVFGEHTIGCGYDIGCQFATTLRQSVLGQRATEASFKCLVGAFHGHAHNRLCQLSHLATYIRGLGIEDLEGCERFFSKSNVLAAFLRYASPFHRKQAISQYIWHHDTFEVSQNLSTLSPVQLYEGLNSSHTHRSL